MSLEPGHTLSHYRLVEKIGAGGMGVVWKAFDTELDREVAIKLLPHEYSKDPDRLERFKREAKVVAALNHPNIVTIHSVEMSGDVHFITMELVRGTTLTRLIPSSGLPLREFLDRATAITDAICAAHQQGITHRDLKPDNVMITDEGRLKILDFGLAKLRDREPEGGRASQLSTEMMTKEGAIVGTLAYMSPEQVEGKSVDNRSDIFSLGVMFFEMATGQRPFLGDTSAAIMTSILRDDPLSVNEVKPSLPHHLGRIVRRCLAKEPTGRYQVPLDLRNDLEELRTEVTSGDRSVLGTSQQSRIGRRRLLVTGLVGLAVIGAGYLLLTRPWRSVEPRGQPLNLAFTKLTSWPGVETFPSISPSGESFVYASRMSGNWDIYLQRIGGEKAINLTEDCPEADSEPSFSPDGSLIAFRSKREGGGIFVMGATGEFVRRLTDGGGNPAWSPDGTKILYATLPVLGAGRPLSASELWTVDVASGENRRISKEDAVQPTWSPHGERIAFWTHTPSGVGFDIFTIPATGGAKVAVTTHSGTDWNPVWSPDGKHLYFSSDRGGAMNLWRVPIDESTGEVLGRPEAITSGGSASRTNLSISSDGLRMVYVEYIGTSAIHSIAFDPVAEAVEGEPARLTRGTMPTGDPHPSPDGERLTFVGNTGMYAKKRAVFTIRTDGTDRRQLTDGLFAAARPNWSPDGQRIAFESNRSGSFEIWTIRPDGSELEQVTNSPEESFVDPVWSPDGSRLAFQNHIVDLAEPSARRTVMNLPSIGDVGGAFWANTWSPDGSRLAGMSGAGAGLFAYSLEEGEYKKLADSGGYSEWLNDSRRLLHVSEGKLFVLDTVTGTDREILRLEPPESISDVAMAPDNRTIFFTSGVSDSDIWMLTME